MTRGEQSQIILDFVANLGTFQTACLSYRKTGKAISTVTIVCLLSTNLALHVAS